MNFQICVLIFAISLYSVSSKSINSNEEKLASASEPEKAAVAAAVSKDNEIAIELSDEELAELASELLRFERNQEQARILYSQISEKLADKIGGFLDSSAENGEFTNSELLADQDMKNVDIKRNALFAHSKQRLAEKYSKKNAIFAMTKQRLADKYNKRNALFALTKQRFAEKYSRMKQ